MAGPTVGSPLSMHDPRTVGPWQVHSRLGAGGMGVVFYATAEGRAAAVKVIRPGLLDAPATRDRFRREVEVLRTVHDVHICEYLDADLGSEPAWLALEYLAGPALRDEIATNGPLDEPAWWQLAADLAQALSTLAQARVTHRDLKPGNVILAERGAVLIDFGIANPEDATSLTATGLVTGSPAWLSPEQANLEPTGPATDVFTLGSLLAFAATGRPPFGEGASVAVLMSIIKRDPDLAGVDPVRASLLRQLMAKDPSERPSAAQVLAAARAGAEGTLAIPMGPDPTLVERPATAGARPPAPSPTVVGPASVLAGGRAAPRAAEPTPVVPPTPRAAGGPAPPPPRTAGPRAVGPRTAAAQRRRAARRRALITLLAVATLLLVGWLLLGNGSSGDAGADAGSGSGTSSEGQAPPAPGSDQLRDGDWLLESYRLDNTDSGLVVSGTVRNKGAETSSADLTVWVYADGESLGWVQTTVSDVPAGAAVPVTMRGDAVWKQGTKRVVLEEA